jgi:hypothetical protein
MNLCMKDQMVKYMEQELIQDIAAGHVSKDI